MNRWHSVVHLSFLQKSLSSSVAFFFFTKFPLTWTEKLLCFCCLGDGPLLWSFWLTTSIKTFRRGLRISFQNIKKAWSLSSRRMVSVLYLSLNHKAPCSPNCLSLAAAAGLVSKMCWPLRGAGSKRLATQTQTGSSSNRHASQLLTHDVSDAHARGHVHSTSLQ